jgi:hypothetical protein
MWRRLMTMLPLRRMPGARLSVAVASLGLLAGCSSVDTLGSNLSGFVYHGDPVSNLGEVRNQSGTLPSNPAEKPTVLPVSSIDINCPDVTISEGGSAYRVGGAENSSVRYQFNIGETARQCDPAGPGQASIKVGVSGNLVIGQAGAPGTFSVPLKVTVTDDVTHKPISSQTYKVEATADAMSTGQFRMVANPVVVPMPTLQLSNLYSITVGFEGGNNPDAGATRPHKRKRTAG